MTVIGHPLTTPVEVSPTDELLHQLTPEQAEALLKRAAISNREWTENNVANTAIRTFLKTHKAYLDNDGNRKQIEFYLKHHNLAVTPETLHSAYTSLSEAGLLSLDAAELRKEKR
jgi:hypothetical protein